MKSLVKLRERSVPRPLDECATLRSGKTPARGRSEYWNGPTPWFSAKDLKSFRLADSTEHISELAVSDGAPLSEKGDILILVRGMTLLKDVPVGVLATEASFNQDIKAIKPVDGISSDYLGYMLAASRPRLMSMVEQAGHGTGRISIERLKSIPVWVPEERIQQFIQDRLHLFEELIRSYDELIGRKATYKRGLAQRLLTGKIRFPGHALTDGRQAGEFGTVPEDWNLVQISDIADELKIRGAGDDAIVYSCTKHRGLVPSLEYFGKRIFSRNLGNYKRIEVGDFAYATNHIEEGSIGLLRAGQSVGLVSPMYTVFRVRSDISSEYLFAVLKTENYRRVFETRMNASVNRRGSLRWNEFAKIKVPLPSRAEQDRITAVLELLDTELALLTAQREQFDRYRRGLLTRLLSGDLEVPGE